MAHFHEIAVMVALATMAVLTSIVTLVHIRPGDFPLTSIDREQRREAARVQRLADLRRSDELCRSSLPYTNPEPSNIVIDAAPGHGEEPVWNWQEPVSFDL